MKVACPSCNANLNIDDKKIPTGGARIKCPTCQQIFPVKAAVSPPPGMAAVPLPGLTAARTEKPSWEEESTRIMPPEMIPGALTNAAPPSNIKAVPLPGQSAPAPQSSTARTGAIPLPGGSAKAAPHWEVESTQVQASTPGSAIPLPGNSEPTRVARPPAPTGGGEVDFADDNDVGLVDSGPTAAYPAIPLPGGNPSFAPRASSGLGAMDEGLNPRPGTMNQGAIPLPGNDAQTGQHAGFDATGQGAIPLPGGYEEDTGQHPGLGTRTDGAIPLPGSYEDTGQHPGLGTRTDGAIPLPGSYEDTGQHPGLGTMTDGAIPLPGSYEDTGQHPGLGMMTDGAIPLPGGYEDTGQHPGLGMMTHGAIPLPGNYEDTGQHPGLGMRPDGAIPLPGGYEDSGHPPGAGARELGAIPLPGSYVPTGPHSDNGAIDDRAIPLPGSYAPTGGHAAFDSAHDDTTGQHLGLEEENAPTATYQSLTIEDLPRPPKAFAFDPPVPVATKSEAAKFDFSDLPSPKGPVPRAPPVAAPSFEAPSLEAPSFEAPSFEAPSFEESSFEDVTFEEPPAPPPRPAKVPAFDFSDLPSPRGVATTRVDRPRPPQYTDLPSPAAAADPFESPDFSNDLPMPSTPDLPSPAEPSDLDFSFDTAPPPPVSRTPVERPVEAPQAVPSFGEVEFDSGNESLEFDPTQTPSAVDDLEADLSAPPQAGKPASSADGLEMLSFIDQTAREAGIKEGSQGKARRFHIRRRSGKVFGPFDDGVIIKMLEDGQLLGNEEVSLDAESWQPIGGEPTFQGAIARLMETPSRAATATTQKVGDPSRQQVASMDRLKNLYEGRMAAVAVVQGKEPVPFRKRLPFILVGLLVAGVLGTGAFLGTTPYGFFGLKVLVPAKVKAGSREFADLQSAQKSLLSDTFKGYQQARDTAQSTLRVKEYPEARAIWCQSIFYLQRKYSAATPAELQQAEAELENIELLGAKNPEVVKARAGSALTHHRADEALALLGDALARSENADDLELTFLRAEAFGQKTQSAQARSELEAILKKKPDSARALHALGNLHQTQKEADLAAGRYEEALKADPEHASSAVELAAIELLIRKDANKGTVAIDQALVATRRDKLGPAELGKALALKAEALAMQHKTEEAIPLFEEALKTDPANAFTEARLAAAYVALHDHAKALPFFKAAAEAAPESLEYAEAYLSSLIALGKMDEAMRVVTASSARFPANARLTYLGARVDDALDRTKEAEAAYLKAAAADPTLVDAHLYLARLYLRFRRLSEARPQLDAALRKAPDNAEVRVVIGELALSENDLDRAEIELKRALELNPVLSEAHVGLSRLELAKGKSDLALAAVDKALLINPTVVGGRLQRGTSLWKLGRLDEAAKELETARVDEPRNTNVIVILGAVQLEKKDLSGATASLMTAIASEPSNPEANFYLAKVKNLKAEHTGAIEHMKKAIELQPKRVEYRYWMGQIYLDAKKNQEAIDEWNAALALDPKYTDALEALGHVFLERNDIKKAVQYFQRALETDPNRSAAQAAIGDAYSQGEQWAQAITTYEKALKADPELKSVYFKLGQAYGEVKNFDQAISHYKKAALVDKDNASIWLSLGYAYKERKQRGEAAAAFERYLAKRPDADNKKEIEDEIDYLKKKEE